MSEIKIGDRVRYITGIEWGPTVGDMGEVTHVFSDGALLVRVDGGCAVYHTHRGQICPDKS